MSIPNNILTNNNMSYDFGSQKTDVLTAWQNDTSQSKPKKLFTKTGKPLKKAIDYNKKLIREGKTSSFILRGFAFNPTTKKQIKITTPTGKLKKFKDKEIYKGTIGKKGDVYKLKARNPQDEPLVWDNSTNNNLNYYLLANLMKGRTGDYRIMINIAGVNVFDNFYKNVDENWWESYSQEFESGGSPTEYIWMKPTDETYFPVGTPITIIITRESRIPNIYYEQKYKQGKTNCLLTPIVNYYTHKSESSKTKKAKNNNLEKVEKLNILKEKFIDGVPDSELENICNDFNIAIDITQPFSRILYKDCKSQTRPSKRFSFINSAPDHVDLSSDCKTISSSGFVKDFDPTIVDSSELNNLVKIAIESNAFYVYTKNNHGYSSLRTLTDYYKLPNTYWETHSEFEEETGLRFVGFNALNYPHLADFVNQGTHFNGTIDFINTDHLEHITKKSIPPNNIEHIDMKSAYANFKHCKYYTGFMGKIQAFRKTDKAIYNGLYYIEDLDFSEANPCFKMLNDNLCWFHDNNVYTKQELDCLTDNGVRYSVKYGAYNLDEFHFEFSKEMLEIKDVIDLGNGSMLKVPYYSKYCGICASLKPYTNYYIQGRKKWLQTIKQGDNLQIYENDYDDETRIAFLKKNLSTKKHITAQITAYQRLQVIEQLLKMDLNKIIRVCCDGIYCYKHNYENKDEVYHKDKEGNYDNPLWRPKPKEMTFQNKPADEYLSNIIHDTNEFQNLKKENWIENVGEAREDFKHQFFAGAGGSGKTTFNIYDKGLIDLVYIAPCWKLASDMKKEYKRKTGKYLPCSVIHRLLNDPYKNKDNYIRRWSNYVIDEASMICEADKQECLKDLPKTIFLGDLDYQLRPVFGSNKQDDYQKQMTLDGFDDIQTFTEIYRFKCDKLKEVANIVRDKIIHNYDYKTLPHFQQITKDKVKDLYKQEDIILVSENQYNVEYNDMFKHIEKYKIKTNSFTNYSNGEIVFEDIDYIPNKDKEFRHGYTIHSVQGLTFDYNIFIDLRSLRLNRMFYTAISRAKRIEQIYLVI